MKWRISLNGYLTWFRSFKAEILMSLAVKAYVATHKLEDSWRCWFQGVILGRPTNIKHKLRGKCGNFCQTTL